jgi:glucosamine-6-phosphate deaminase
VSNFQLRVFSPGDWPELVAAELAARLRGRPHLRLCLPTGDTPAPVYAKVVALNREGRAPFAEATVLLLDEYVGLAPTDAARCDARLRRELVDRLTGGSPTFHAIAVDDLPPEAAATAHDELAAEGLDLALLGLGMNGHVGLNEPGSTAESPTRVVELATDSRASATERYGASLAPRRGITLGIARLLEADELWLLVTGERKREMLRRVLEGSESSDCPATFLRRHPRLNVLCDTAAVPDS